MPSTDLASLGLGYGTEAKTSILFLGDLMLGRLVNSCILENVPEFVWGNTLPILQSADAVLGNLEGVIIKDSESSWQMGKVFHFQADPKAIEVLKVGHVTYISNANNHALDLGQESLLEMLKLLDEAGIAHSGAGCHLGQARHPAVFPVDDLKLAVIAWTDNEPSWKVEEDFPGVNYLKVHHDSLRVLRDQISQVQQSDVDLIVVSAHWGTSMKEFPPLFFQDFAKSLIDAGVDIFYGHSAHVFQGVEIYKGKLIMYDTGDFIDDYAVDPKLRNDYSYIFKVWANRLGVQKLELIPVHINGKRFFQVNLAEGEAIQEIHRRMRYRSSVFGTQFDEEGEKLILNF